MQLGTPTSGSKEELLQVIQHYRIPGNSAPSQATSYRRPYDRRSPLQESQLQSFLISGALCGSHCMKIFLYMRRKIGHTWMTTFSIDTSSYSEKQKWQHWSRRMKFVINKKETNTKKSTFGKQRRVQLVQLPSIPDVIDTMSSSHQSAFIKLKADWIIIIYTDFLICETSFE